MSPPSISGPEISLVSAEVEETPDRLESRIFRRACQIIVLVGAAAASYDLAVGNSLTDVALALSASLGSGLFLLVSPASRNLHRLRVAFMMFLLGILVLAWLTNFGLDGGAPFFFSSFFVLAAIILRPKGVVLVSLTAALIVVGLVTLHFTVPQLTFEMNLEERRASDVTATFVISLTANASLVYLVVSGFQEQRRRRAALFDQMIKDKEKLAQAFREIRTLEGILPVCGYCKKIRNSDDEWLPMESYIQQRSNAEFSHTICEDCAREKHPDFFRRRQERQG